MILICCPSYCYNIFYKEIHVLSNELKLLHYKVKIHILNSLQHEDISQNEYDNITNKCIFLFGSQHIKYLDSFLEKNHVIIYNLEQLIFQTWDHIITKWKNAIQIWDYSIKNIQYTQSNFLHIHKKHILVHLGYSPFYIIDKNHSQNENNIIFIGNISNRRRDIVNQIPNSLFISNVYFNNYSDVLLKYNKFLNIHYRTPAILEIVRILSLVCNEKIIFSEKSCDDDLDNMFKDVIFFIDINNISSSFNENVSFPFTSFELFKQNHSFQKYLEKGLLQIPFSFFHFQHKLAIATLHCNDRNSIFETIDSFINNTSFFSFFWIILSQGCSASHNEKLKKILVHYNINHKLLIIDDNLGWSKGMNFLYMYLMKEKYDFVLHLEDDWICDSFGYIEWLQDCYIYMICNQKISTLFLRHYKTPQEKFLYGWDKHIYYQCFKYPNPFNYHEKIKQSDKIKFRSLIFRKIPQFLYTANPTFFRLNDYKKCNVFPFPIFDDKSNNRNEWKITTIHDAHEWGNSEAISMEKIINLTCMNVNTGFFHHKF
jgi:hypothetical protein